jgi:hypothetical protein
MKSNTIPTHFTPTGLAFSDGTEIQADVIVFCTGFTGNMRTDVAKIFGEDVAESVRDFWGLDEEGELKGAFRETGRKSKSILVLFLCLGYLFRLLSYLPPSFVTFTLLPNRGWDAILIMFLILRSRPVVSRRHDWTCPVFLTAYCVANQGCTDGDALSCLSR